MKLGCALPHTLYIKSLNKLWMIVKEFSKKGSCRITDVNYSIEGF